MRFLLIFVVVIFVVPSFGVIAGADDQAEKTIKILLTKQDLRKIGLAIFKNECNGKAKNLTHWNKGEHFASLGIGHFIWYPHSGIKPFKESFPDLLFFLKANHVTFPLWLDNLPDNECPWKNRDEFLAAENSYRMNSLRNFLKENFHLQSLFILKRLQHAYPKILSAAPSDSREHVMQQFIKIASSKEQLYALIDYVNFKGEGIKTSERYNSQGWGLLQVLVEMKSDGEEPDALQEFSKAAENVLKRRVKNSPPERNEKRWLPGWKNRINSYKNLQHN
jgi:hypothetical protein